MVGLLRGPKSTYSLHVKRGGVCVKPKYLWVRPPGFLGISLKFSTNLQDISHKLSNLLGRVEWYYSESEMGRILLINLYLLYLNYEH